MNSQFGMGHKCESDFPKRGGYKCLRKDTVWSPAVR